MQEPAPNHKKIILYLSVTLCKILKFSSNSCSALPVRYVWLTIPCYDQVIGFLHLIMACATSSVVTGLTAVLWENYIDEAYYDDDANGKSKEVHLLVLIFVPSRCVVI